MKKSLQITSVRTIFTIAKPIVVFEVANHPAIIRTPKQALNDLQNSGRCLEIDTKLLANGIEYLNPFVKAMFQKSLLRTRGAFIEGDFTAHKAGEKYYPNDKHPVFTDSSHPQFGTIKQGEALIAKEDGVYIEGFCTIAETEEELTREANANAYAMARVSMSTSFMNIPVPVAEEMEIPTPVTQVSTEAFAETPSVKTKK